MMFRHLKRKIARSGAIEVNEETTTEQRRTSDISDYGPSIAVEERPNGINNRRISEASSSFGLLNLNQESLSSISNQSPVLVHRSSTRSGDRSQDPMGIHVLHDPGDTRTIDIIFVHGLGGSSRLSWCWNKDLSLFWPKEWLPLEPELEDARILTFGYNAHFATTKADMFNISDFAKDLLLQMKFGSNSEVQALDIGKVPLIFVVHSMGGLVVKKAYLLGCNDPQYRDILHAVCSIIFLATPHRGSGLAETLNRVLSLSGFSPKEYVNDLQRNSTRIRDINDQFRLHATRMQVVSFFETAQTSVGVKKTIIVDKDSAVLDYPDEISSPLNANHHTVCKYQSPTDANYASVRNVMKSMVSKFKMKITTPVLSRHSSIRSQSSLIPLLTVLEVDEHQTQELELLQEKCVPESCEWILTDRVFDHWLNHSSRLPVFLHIAGLPGSGKSIAAAFLAAHLQEDGHRVQTFFFRHDDHLKRSVRHCVLSLIFQMASTVPPYRRLLMSTLEGKPSLAKLDARALWQKLVIGLLAKIGHEQKVIWILDALDECDNTHLLMSLLQSLAQKPLPLRIILLTRPQSMTRQLERFKGVTGPGRFSSLSMAAPETAFRAFIAQELQYASWRADLMEQVSQTLIEKSHGNFLWLFLVLKELLECITKDDVEIALSETPAELSEIYVRMVLNLKCQLRVHDLKLAMLLFSWITCSESQLHLDDLQEALHPEFPVLDLGHTVGKLCGDFVAIDRNGRLSMVHHTAKEFLLQQKAGILQVDSTRAHEQLFSRCLSTLLDARMRYKLKTSGCTGFLRYACLSWSQHLAKSGTLSWSLIREMAIFFSGQNVLTWIQAVGMTGSLRVLTTTAKSLSVFVDRQRQANYEEPGVPHPLEELELCKEWTTELVRLVGKFGSHLVLHPEAIYFLIPAFCPSDSVVGRLFSPKNPRALQVSGLSNTGWDDSLSQFSVGYDCQPTIIACLEGHFAILTTDENVNLYHASTFQEARSFLHGELILALAFNQEGDHLVTCGSDTVRIWDVSTGRETHRLENPQGVNAISVSFSSDSSSVIVCCTDSSLRLHGIESEGRSDSWFVIDKELRDDAFHIGSRGTPVCTAFSSDGTQIAMSFRGIPLHVWGTDSSQLIGRGERIGEKNKSKRDLWSYAQRLQWNAITNHVVGIYNDGCVFKWYPLDNHSQEIEVPIIATEIACSPDGRFVVTASGNGSLRVWSFDNFSLLYHLSCTSPVTDIAISADGRRICDLRESFCNIWEPNALIRLRELEDRVSDSASSQVDSVAVSLPSETSAVLLEPITALAVAEDGAEYCACNAGGILFHFNASGRHDIPLSYYGITHMAWSHDKLLATAEMDGTVSVRTIEGDFLPIWKTRSKNPVRQLLFLMDGASVLVQCTHFTTIWSINSGSYIARKEMADGAIHWIRDPCNPDGLLAVIPDSISAFSPRDLTVRHCWQFSNSLGDDFELPMHTSRPLGSGKEHTASTKPGIGRDSIDKVLLSPTGDDLLVQISKSTEQGKHSSHFMLVNTKKFTLTETGTTSDESSSTLPERSLPQSVVAEMEVLLGFVIDDVAMGNPSSNVGARSGSQARVSLVFTDHDFWVCSWPLGEEENFKRHYFLPRDWVNMECLNLALTTNDGRLLCPRSGEVAVFANGLQQEWAG